MANGTKKRRTSYKLTHEGKKVVIVIVSAAALALITIVVSALLESPVASYYPHDDERSVVRESE